MRIVFTGGGTGGHVYPILAVAREIKRIAEEERILDLELFYFGPEPYVLPELANELIIFKRITAGKFRSYFSFQNFSDVLKTLLGLGQALGTMFFVMPDVVFSKGAYGSFPTLVAARLYRIPVIIHESDAIPGRVHQWAGRFAARIAISFAPSAQYFPKERTALTGVPIRKRLLGGTVDAARETFGIFSHQPVILVVGGSQGAQIINNTITPILKELTATFEVIHQTGENNFEDLRLETRSLWENGGAEYYHLAPFLDEDKMRDAYLLADLIISRAGATAIFEIAAWGKPSILIPLKISAQHHQRENAYTYGRHGAAVVIEEDNLTSSVLFNEIKKLMAHPNRRSSMADAARSFARLDAAELIAREILTLGLHQPYDTNSHSA